MEGEYGGTDRDHFLERGETHGNAQFVAGVDHFQDEFVVGEDTESLDIGILRDTHPATFQLKQVVFMELVRLPNRLGRN